jgi:transcriptional regulator GlxA family with amidase domain
MKNRKSFISDLILWINNNIETHLKIDDIAIKSGYSKWHLQRLFFAETGETLGHFIRERKLILVADKLITTNEPLINLAIKYGLILNNHLPEHFIKNINYLHKNTERNLAVSTVTFFVLT